MRMFAVCLSVLVTLLPYTAAFAGTSSKRVFVGTPVSKYPKHLGASSKPQCICGVTITPAHYVRTKYPCTICTVSDRMTMNPKTLSPDTSVDEAILTLMSWGVTGAPIVDERTGSKLLGVVSSYDFLQKEAFEGALLPMEGSEEHVKQYANAAQRICGQSIGDIMTTNPRTVSPNDTMRVAAELMSNERLHHLPVVVRFNE